MRDTFCFSYFQFGICQRTVSYIVEICVVKNIVIVRGVTLLTALFMLFPNLIMVPTPKFSNPPTQKMMGHVWKTLMCVVVPSEVLDVDVICRDVAVVLFEKVPPVIRIRILEVVAEWRVLEDTGV